MSDFLKDALKDVGNILEPPAPAWDLKDLGSKVLTDTISGAVVGSIFDGVGLLPGAIVGGVAGVSEWAAINLSRANAASHNEAVKALPEVILHGPAPKR